MRPRKETLVTRSKLHGVVLAVLAIVAAQNAVAGSGDEAQWPNVALDEPQWPNVRPEDLPDPTPNPHPPFLDFDQVTNRILAAGAALPAVDDKPEVTGSFPRWMDLPSQPSPFAFEVGARYWYSWGKINFGFTNGDPLYGNPTSTLNWHGLAAHSGEAFARIDHKPTGMFVKGLFGLGSVVGGHIEDRDFLVQQISFSDTTSDVKDGRLTYGMIDLGWGYSPVPDIRVGFFGGYHYWNERVTAYGVRCNAVMYSTNFCGPAGSIAVPFDTAVLRYEPTWHAVRLGFEGRAVIRDRWSVSGEIAAVPFAVVQNRDSHLLRQSFADLGPAPNVITDSNYAFGIEAEMFINYAVTPNIEIGGGARYWGLASYNGGVTHGPAFAISDKLNNFEMQRVGVLAQIKGKF